MIKAAHQYSTIRTTYDDVRKSYVSDVQPFKPLVVQMDYQICGEVSGTYFTRYAKNMADSLGVKGWMRVSPRGEIYGQIQGEKDKVDEMAIWLRSQGSPHCRIGAAQFSNWKIIEASDFRNFTIRY